MQKTITLITCICALCPSILAQTNLQKLDTSSSWLSQVQANLEKAEYNVSYDEAQGYYQSPNRANNLRAIYSPNQFRLKNRVDSVGHNWSINVETLGVFADGEKIYSPLENAKEEISENTISYNHTGYREEFVNTKDGVRQNFIINSAPSQTKELSVQLAADGLELDGTGGEVRLYEEKDGKKVVRLVYKDIVCWDANKQPLTGEIKSEKGNIVLSIDVKNAVFPITIDPLYTLYNPVLSVGQSNAFFGDRVSNAGDVNGDGYDDIIISAFNYDNGQTDEGAAFVYLGSSSGLVTTVHTLLEENQAGAKLGVSIASAGDVNGDGYDDVIVGADRYSNGQTEEGAAFIYLGSSSGVNSVAAIQLEKNQVQSFFGRSVSSAGDVNGDGYDDVIIGAYNYDNGQTNEGVAFIYHGSSTGIGSSSASQIEENQAYANFGNKVSSAGDIDGDGYDDVIVGALFYDNGQTNEGAAFVYHGSSTGINTAASNVFEGNQSTSNMGDAVSGAGDVNGDGYDDIIVGASRLNNAVYQEGASFLYLGSSTGISSSDSIRIEMNQTGAQFGSSVSSAGDVNGDGYDDVIISASRYDNGQTDEGVTFIFFGSALGIDTSSSILLEENQASSHFGTSVSNAGDVNGDGYDDILIGAGRYDNYQTNEGAAFVYYGSHTGIVQDSSASVSSDKSSSKFGYSVSGAGDVNGDGYSDVIVGAYHYDNGQTDEGAAFLFYGSSLGLNTSSIHLEQNQSYSSFGVSVSSAGDVNGDGYSDVIVGAIRYDNGQTDEGAAFIYLGSSSGISTTANSQMESNQVSANFGISVSSAGDVNGDGYSDVIVGSHWYDNGQTDEGAVFVYHGSSSGVSATASSQRESNQAGAVFGLPVSSAGDVNGDGYSDVIVGASKYDNGEVDEGAVFVYHGSSTGISSTASSLMESNQASASFGVSASSAGDVNGDGYSDVIVGAYKYDNGQTDEGAVFVYHGSSSGISTTVSSQMEGDQASAWMGISVSSAGDVNGDGYSDVIVGTYGYDNGQTDEGAVFVYHGSPNGIDATASSQMESNQSTAYFGGGVSCAGDVNGDGYSDVIVGAYNYGQVNEGAAFLYHGSASGLSDTCSSQLERNQGNSRMGAAVSDAGDVNGDGYGDVIVGAYFFDNGQANEGAAFVYHGSDTGLAVAPSSQMQSNQAEARFGQSVSTAGDVNGDGYSDIVVGAFYYDGVYTDEGAAYVYHGSSSGINNSVVSHIVSSQANARLGVSVSGAGDVNNDGYSDIVVGANRYDNGNTDEGAAFVYHGSSSGIDTSIAAHLECNQANAYFGFSVSEAGDVNGDGYSDIVVGANQYDNGETDEGAAFIYHGSSSGINTTVATQLESNQANAKMGRSVNSAGDVNGDGYSDVLIASHLYDNGETDEGVVFVHLGSDTGLVASAATVLESNQASSLFGFGLASAGDVNGDGYDDIVIGAYQYDSGQANEGVAFIYHGSEKGILTKYNQLLEIDQASARFGFAVSGAGDVNGDGYGDVIVGADYYDNGQANEGGAFVYLGNNGGSMRNNLRVYDDNTTSLLTQNSTSDANMGIGLYAKSPQGRQKAKVVWETKSEGQAFSSASPITNSTQFTGQGSSYTDLGTNGTELKEVIAKTGSIRTRIRARVKYDPANSITGQVYGPWRYVNDVQMRNLGYLPVEYVYFTAHKCNEDSDAKLLWATATEENNEGFIVQRSLDNASWVDIGFVSGSGTSSSLIEYSFIDESPLRGLNYYRLIQIDFDGNKQEGETRVLDFQEGSEISLYPNPSKGDVTLSAKRPISQIEVRDLNGKIVSTVEGKSNAVSLSLTELRNGVYFISVKQEDGSITTKKLVVSR